MRRNYRILVVDDFEKRFFEELSKYGEFLQKEDLDEASFLYDPDVLIVRSKTKVNRKAIDSMPSLKLVVSPTHGIDHVDAEYLKERGIEFYNIPVQAYDVAQGVIGYIYCFATRLVEGNRWMKKRKWKKHDLKGFRIREKTLGIIGYGKIGREVYKLANSIGLNTIIYDKNIVNYNPIVFNSPKYFEKLLRVSDIITIHVPLAEDTKGLIGKDEIEKMKDGVYIINTSRGGIIDEDALLKGLKNGKIAGAALDVYEHTPPFDSDSWKLVKLDNLIATPHSVAQTEEAMDNKERSVLNCIKKWEESQI